MSDLAKILAENQTEMLKLITPMAKKQPALTVPEETDSEPESTMAYATSAPVKTKPNTVNPNITPLNSRNTKRDKECKYKKT